MNIPHPIHDAKRPQRIAGQLSRTEVLLWSGARGIDLLFDQLRDRPLASLAAAAAVAAVFALLLRHA